MFKVGQWIYGIEVTDDDYDAADVCAYLFMAECGDYIICCCEYIIYTGKFEEQLASMYEECMENSFVGLTLLKKDLCFETEAEANDCLERLRNE